MKISIVIPVFNESGNIRALIERIALVFSASDEYEVIFIDDNSTDGTFEEINRYINDYPIKVFKKIGVSGKAQCLVEGFRHVRYPIVCMIDGDLQYPPESIPDLLKKLETADIVIGNRVTYHKSLVRRAFGKLFKFVFLKLLHNLDYDVQSGFKIFKREIIERVKLHPKSEWMFDLEFIKKSINAGYKIATVDIVFGKRLSGQSKLSAWKSAFGILYSGIYLKFSRLGVVRFHPNHGKIVGKGFNYKGAEYVHHSRLPQHESAFFNLSRKQKGAILLIILLFITSLLLNWHATLIIFIGILTFIYLLNSLFDLFLILRTYKYFPDIKITKEILDENSDYNWPLYTILCPLYKEWKVLPQFITAISKLDYPKEKLQVILLLEEDDGESIRNITMTQVPDYFDIVIVPHSLPKTKPKALNYGLLRTRGKYLVVYDAEDVPDPNQLKKAVLAFDRVDEKTICLQSKLNFYNPHHNILTRVFTAEYSLWFNLILSGLQSISAPIPLGGTSNHFQTKNLKFLKGWDAFNVTEDCDLGMRIAKMGYKTAMLNSTTLEEANSDLFNWFNQRSRWIKGYIQTYFVHMRRPSEFSSDLKHPNILIFQIIIGSKILSMFINPFMWIVTLSYFLLSPQAQLFVQSFYPQPVLYMGAFALIIGNFLYLYYYMLGCARKKQYGLIKYALLTPIYWLFMSIAGVKAVIQLITTPHYWAKTRHGLHLTYNKSLNEARRMVGGELVDQRVIA